MQFDNPLFLIGILVGPVFLLAGYILLRWPPKNINSLYGYRTPRSMKNQTNWDYAQRYSARLLMLAGLFFLLIAPIGLFLGGNDMLFLVIALGLLSCVCVLLLVVTEKSLKQREREDLE